MTRYAVLAAAAASAALLGWHWRRFCAWWKNHDRAGTAVILTVLAAAALAAGITRLRWGTGFDPRPYEASLPYRVAARWWAAKAHGHRVDAHLDTTRAGLAAGLAMLVGVAAHALRPTGETPTRTKKHRVPELAPERIVEAFVAAGALPPGKGGLNPRVSFHGKAVENDFGKSITVALPPTTVYTEVVKRQTALASQFGVPEQQLRVTHADHTAPNVVTLWIGNPLPKIGSGRTAAVATARRTRWADGVVIGRQVDGTDVVFVTRSTHTGVFGATRVGKTVLVRTVLATALLDPTVTVWGVSGKGERADWDAMAPCCRSYIGTVDDDMPAKFAALLRQVDEYRLAKAHASRDEGRAEPAAVLLIEELAALRAHCETVLGAAGADAVDKQVATLLATASSAGVHIILIAQRPTVDNLPSRQSANIGQRVVLRTTKKGDTAIALGDAPENPRPTRKGQALILDSEHGERFALVDYLTDEQWEDICERAAELRGIDAEPVAGVEDDPSVDDDPAVVDDEAPVVDVDPLLAAAAEALEQPGQLTPTELFEALPDALRPTSAATLGKRLAARGLASQMVDKRRVYTHAAAVSAVAPAVAVPSP